MVCKFSDLSKAPTDLLSDDYQSKVSLKCKKAAGPVAVTIDSTRAADGKISAKVGTKFSYAGLSFDKVQLEASGAQTLETSLSPYPGVKLSFKGGKGADLGCDYKSGNFMGTAKLDVKDLAKFSTSAAMTVSGGVTLGGDAGYSIKDSSLSSYNVGASYASGPMFGAITTANKMESFAVSTLYKVNSEVTLASSSTHSAKDHSLVAFGGSYKAAFGDVKAKIGSDGILHGSLVKEIAPKVKITASGTITKFDTSTFKYGLGVTM